MGPFSSVAWALPYLVVGVASAWGRSLQSATGIEFAAFVACVIGCAAGIIWVAAYPRPLAERLTGLAGVWIVLVVLFGLSSLVRALGGSLGTVSFDDIRPYPVIAAISVLAGLVLGEIATPTTEGCLDWRPSQSLRGPRSTNSAADFSHGEPRFAR